LFEKFFGGKLKTERKQEHLAFSSVYRDTANAGTRDLERGWFGWRNIGVDIEGGGRGECVWL